MNAALALINTFILSGIAIFYNDAILTIPTGISFALFLSLVDKGENNDDEQPE